MTGAGTAFNRDALESITSHTFGSIDRTIAPHNPMYTHRHTGTPTHHHLVHALGSEGGAEDLRDGARRQNVGLPRVGGYTRVGCQRGEGVDEMMNENQSSDRRREAARIPPSIPPVHPPKPHAHTQTPQTPTRLLRLEPLEAALGLLLPQDDEGPPVLVEDQRHALLIQTEPGGSGQCCCRGAPSVVRCDLFHGPMTMGWVVVGFGCRRREQRTQQTVVVGSRTVWWWACWVRCESVSRQELGTSIE